MARGRGRMFALSLLALVPALSLAFFGGVLPAPVPDSSAPYSDADWAGALDAEAHGKKDEALSKVRSYLAQLRSAGPSTRPLQFPAAEEVEAFWLNAYDALALQAVLETGAPAGALRWAFVPHALAGRWLTQDAIERRLRASEDPRIYFALTLLRRGDPALPDAPFRGRTLDTQLNASARHFLGDPGRVRLEAGVLHLPALLDGELREVAQSGASQSLLQLVWTFLPRVCEEYPGCVTRADLDRACGPHLDRCPLHFDPMDARPLPSDARSP